MEYQDDQLRDQLKAGINGAIHSVQYIWDKNLTTEDWVFLFVDAKNTFSEINQVRMMWTFIHLWLPGARFVLNCYCHWSSLVLRNGNGKPSFMHGKEGVMQE